MTLVRNPEELEALRDRPASHMTPDGQPDARGMGAESAEYITPMIDPQWIDAWKMFLDRDGTEYGVPVRLPRGQWAAGGPNALMNLRRPDGGFWFTAKKPVRTMAEPKYECFVGECTKKLHTRSKLVSHVETFHFEEAKSFRDILMRIKRQVAHEDPRLQKLVAELGVEGEGVTEEDVEVAANEGVFCHACGVEIVGPLSGHECEKTKA